MDMNADAGTNSSPDADADADADANASAKRRKQRFITGTNAAGGFRRHTGSGCAAAKAHQIRQA